MSGDRCAFCHELWHHHTEPERRSCIADLRARAHQEWHYVTTPDNIARRPGDG